MNECKKTLFEKIQIVRVEMQKREIKKSGMIANDPKRPYMELDDFTKPLNELMLANRFTAIASFLPEIATLTAYDFDSAQILTVTSPMREVKVPGCNEMQGLGAVETYQRRYLYNAMFDIAESDTLDGSAGKDKQSKETESKTQTLREKRMEELTPFGQTKDGKDRIAALIAEAGSGKKVEELSEAIFKKIIQKLSEEAGNG